MHLIVSAMLLSKSLYRISSVKVVRHISGGILTFLNAPLFCDWQVFFEESNFQTPITQCWIESKKLHARFQVLLVVESYMALMPMIFLKAAVDHRNNVLNEGIFKPLPDEILSTRMVNMLLILGFLVPIANSILQTGLAFLYFRFRTWLIIAMFD